jgi:tetratricopeptide (TPR) repeat protein
MKTNLCGLSKYAALLVVALALVGAASCESSHSRRTIEREYAYKSSDADNQQTAQTIAATEMREILIRDAEEFLHPELRNSKDAQKVEAVTAGVVGMEIMDQKWDSVTGRFYILARVVVDPHKTTKKINDILKDKSKTQELFDSRKRAKEAKTKIQILSAEAQTKKSPVAKEAYSKAAKKLAVEEYFVQGFNAQESGAPDRAIDMYQKAIELTPEDALVYIKMGSAYADKSDYKLAIVYFERAININPYSAYAYNNMGNAYAAIHDYTQAIYCFDKAILIDPHEPYAYNNKGNAYSAQKNYVGAIELYTKAVTTDQSFAGAYSNMGTAYAEVGNYNQAIDCYQKAISLEPNLYDAYNNMGYAYYEVKHYPQAINCYKKAISINPNFAEAYNNIGLVYGAQGNISQQKEFYIKAAKLGDVNARRWLAANDNK